MPAEAFQSAHAFEQALNEEPSAPLLPSEGLNSPPAVGAADGASPPGLARVTPIAVPISAARLGEILGYYTLKTSVEAGFDASMPGDPVGLSPGASSGSARSTAGSISGFSAAEPELSDVPIAAVVGALPAGAVVASTTQLTQLSQEETIAALEQRADPRRFRRLRLWWRSNGGKTLKIVGLVVLAAGAVALTVFCPLAGMFIVLNLGFLAAAGAGAAAQRDRERVERVALVEEA